jgi:hypothetical protein
VQLLPAYFLLANIYRRGLLPHRGPGEYSYSPSCALTHLLSLALELTAALWPLDDDERRLDDLVDLDAFVPPLLSNSVVR